MVTSTSTGYSGRALVDKLGVKPGARIKTRHAPKNYLNLLQPLPADVVISSGLRTRVSMWHVFTRSRTQLKRTLEQARHQVNQDGMIWVSWPKKSSGVASEVTEDVIRDVALPMGLVDVKVCAVDETWSALKLVIRVTHRR